MISFIRQSENDPVARHGLSLLELTTVVLILGVLATVGITRFGTSTLENLSAQAEARRIALELNQARRRAIASGDDHYVRFSLSFSGAASYVVMRSASGGDTEVDEPRVVDASLSVTNSHQDNIFAFDGTATSAYSITVAGPDRTWQVSVIPATGLVRVQEVL